MTLFDDFRCDLPPEEFEIRIVVGESDKKATIVKTVAFETFFDEYENDSEFEDAATQAA